MLHVKLNLLYIVSFTCNIYFLNLTHLVFNQFKSEKFSRCFFAVEYISTSCLHRLLCDIFSKAKETREFDTLKLIKNKKYVEFKKCVLHVKLTIYYTVSFTCNRHFLNSTYFILNQFKSNKISLFFLLFFFAAGYI